MLESYKKSIRHYSEAGYILINGCLRRTEPCSPETLSHIANLKEVVSRSKLADDYVGYRGITQLELGTFYSMGVGAGSVVTTETFLSISDKAAVANLHRQKDGRGIIVKFFVPRGVNAFVLGTLSAYPEEAEMLMCPGTSYQFMRDLDAQPFTVARVLGSLDSRISAYG